MTTKIRELQNLRWLLLRLEPHKRGSQLKYAERFLKAAFF